MIFFHKKYVNIRMNTMNTTNMCAYCKENINDDEVECPTTCMSCDIRYHAHCARKGSIRYIESEGKDYCYKCKVEGESDDEESKILPPEHFIIRVGDGYNFRNSNFDFWGMKSNGGSTKTLLKNNLKEGDILWFATSKIGGSKFLGVATYTHMFDRDYEPLFDYNTISSKDQGWKGDTDWSIRVHYTNLYKLEHVDYNVCYQGGSLLIKRQHYENGCARRGKEDAINLITEYRNIIKYIKPEKPKKL